jgi:hypothetical protein
MQREAEMASMGDWAAKEDDVKIQFNLSAKKTHLIDY